MSLPMTPDGDAQYARGCVIESILFAAGESVPVERLAAIFDATREEIRADIAALSQYYSEHGRGLRIIELDGAFQLCTVEENYPYIQQILEPRRKQGLSPAAMETLAIVAYNQPITRSSVEYIRGVNSDGPVNRLIERGLIEEAGRLDAPGRPILYVTTQEFLRAFGLTSLEDLPDVSAFQVSLPEELAEETVDGEMGVL